MLGLPKSTELKKQLPKNAVFAKFNMNTAARDKFDSDISRMFIVNEVSARSAAVAEGKNISSFFVVNVQLKTDDYDEKNIISIAKLIPQNIVFLLEYDGKERLAVYHTKLFQSEWKPEGTLSLSLTGLDLDAVWENVLVHTVGIVIEQGNSLDEQIAADDRRAKIQKEIARLEKLARAEKQPKKKFELVKQIKELKSMR